MTDLLVVLVSAPDAERGATLGRTLVEERLAACVTLLPQAHSIYRWEGAVVEEREVVLLIKAPRAGFEALRARIVALHPYAVPEILALPVELGHVPYLRWAEEQIAGPAASNQPEDGSS